ncbi:MAG: redoxin domain-containing protein [Terriglobia bacterium]
MGKSSSGPLKVGDRAPDFSLPDQNGNLVKLSDYVGKKTVVLAFFIKAFTGGCTKELNTYQRDILKFDQASAQVISISVDSPAKNKAYAESLKATYPILSDHRRAVSREYGVLMPVIRLAKRVTFVIDQRGIIQAIQRGGDAMDPANSLVACATGEQPRV